MNNLPKSILDRMAEKYSSAPPPLKEGELAVLRDWQELLKNSKAQSFNLTRAHLERILELAIPAQKDAEDASAWLIETKENTPRWLSMCGDGEFYWDTVAAEATRFARKKDAEEVIKHYGWNNAFASEHGWPNLKSPASKAGTCE